MTDVEILQECRMAAVEERVLSRQIERMKKIGGPRGIGTQAIEPAGDRKTNNATAGQLQKLDGLIERLERLRDENIGIIQKAEAIIGNIRNRKDRIVIRCYYVEGDSEYEIAGEVDMSRQWVNQRRNQLIEEMQRQKKKIKNSRILLK